MPLQDAGCETVQLNVRLVSRDVSQHDCGEMQMTTRELCALSHKAVRVNAREECKASGTCNATATHTKKNKIHEPMPTRAAVSTDRISI